MRTIIMFFRPAANLAKKAVFGYGALTAAGAAMGGVGGAVVGVFGAVGAYEEAYKHKYSWEKTWLPYTTTPERVAYCAASATKAFGVCVFTGALYGAAPVTYPMFKVCKYFNMYNEEKINDAVNQFIWPDERRPRNR